MSFPATEFLMTPPIHLIQLSDAIVGKVKWSVDNHRDFSAIVYLNKSSYDLFYGHLLGEMKKTFNSPHDEIILIQDDFPVRVDINLRIKPNPIAEDSHRLILHAGGADTVYYEQS